MKTPSPGVMAAGLIGLTGIILVSIGAHGQQAGIGAHWELWSFVRGGMTPIQALRAGTIVPARSLGMGGLLSGGGGPHDAAHTRLRA